MKKITKSITIMALIATIVVVMSTCIMAIQPDIYHSIEKTERIISLNIENSSGLTDEQIMRIKNDVVTYHLNGKIPETISPHGLTCVLLGHNTETHMVTVVEHKVYKTIPRCLESVYNVTTCSRCDYEEIKLIFQREIVCCPED